MRVVLVFLTLAACADAGTTDTTGEDSGTTPPQTTGSCTALEAGAWVAAGDAFGMAMVATLAVDECTFTLDDWDMVMGSVPTGGTLVGAQVTLTGGDWASCTGTAASATEMSGTCGGSKDWTLTRDER